MKVIKLAVSIFAVLLLAACGNELAKKTSTLDTTKEQGFVKCGVSQGLPGFSNADASGNWAGIDVDVCRAVAAAGLVMQLKLNTLH